MSRKYDPKFDGPRTSKPKTSTADEQNGKELMPLGNSVNIPAQPQNTAQTLEQKQSPTKASIHSVPSAVMNYEGSFLDPKSLARFAVTSKNHHRIFREDKKGELKKRAIQQLLQHVVRGEQAQAEAMIKANLDLLLETGRIETYAKDLNGNPVMVEGTVFQLALAAEDDEMAKMIAKYLDEHHPYVDENNPGEKLKQYRAQFPVSEQKEEKAEEFKSTPGGKALNTIISAITNASVRACELVLNHEENIPADDKEAQDLLTALNTFRDYLAPKKDPQGKVIPITTGKHFNMQLLIKAFELYDRNYDAFDGFDSPKNNLCWRKVIGFMQRFLPAHYAQAFAQGIYYIVEEGEKFRWSFDFRYGGGFFFPLDADPNFRLGYNYAAEGAGGGALARVRRLRVGVAWRRAGGVGCRGFWKIMSSKNSSIARNYATATTLQSVLKQVFSNVVGFSSNPAAIAAG